MLAVSSKFKIIKGLAIISALTLIFGCGGIPKYKKGDLIPLINAEQIEGEYKNYENDSLKLHHISINGNLNWRKKHFDSTDFTSVKIKILNKKLLKMDFLFDGRVLKTRKINYRLRNNGFLKLRNQSTRIVGVPIIFGDYEVNKYQLGLNKNNDLILHGIKDQAGGLLIIISSGIVFEVYNVYQRI